MNLKEALLTVYGTDWLNDFAKKAGLEDLKTPEDTVNAICETLLDPHVMKENLMVFRDDDIAFLRFCLKQKKPFHPSSANYESADRLRDIPYGFVIDQDMNFIVPDDVKKVFQEIDTPQFEEQRSRMSWLNDCVHLIPCLYAILSVGDLGTLYRRHRGFSESNEEIVMTMLEPLRQRHDFPCVLQGKELIAKGLKETGQEERLREIHETLPVAFPSYSELRDLIENGFPSRKKSWQDLKRYLLHDLKVTEEFAEPLLNGIWQYIACGNAFTDILKMVRKEGVPVPKEKEASFEKVLVKAWGDTRMIMCNGDTPAHAMPYAENIFTEN